MLKRSEVMMEYNSKSKPVDRTNDDQKDDAGLARRFAEMFYQSGRDFFTDNAPQWSAAIAYYGLLSVFPLLLAAASIAAYFVAPSWAVDQLTQLMGDYLPKGAGQIEQIVKQAVQDRGGVGVISFLLLVWSGSRVFSSITKALNIAYDVDDTYGFFRRTLIEFALMLTVGVVFIAAISSRWLLGLAWNNLVFLPRVQDFISQIILEVLSAALLMLVFFLVYRFVPRERVNWRAALFGSFLAVVLFLLARSLFLSYVNRFANYNVIYGSFAVVIVIVIWSWLVACILLLGGEVVSHTQQMLIEGSTIKDVQQRHLARSPSHKVDES